MSVALARRLLGALLTALAVVCVVAVLLRLVPGDPVEAMLGEGAAAADRAALRAALGLDRPVAVQVAAYLGGVLRLDLGESLHTGRPVAELLAERLPATAELAAAGWLVAVALALPLGTLAALRRASAWDRLATAFASLGVSIPNFWLGPLLILAFSVHLGWLPVSGRGEPGALVLPALTLGTALAALLTRMVRASLLEVLGEDYVRAARAKGLGEGRVLWAHAMRNALLPVVTVMGLQLGGLLAGTVITETVFAWPGVGLLLVEAISRRDFPVVQGCVLLVSLGYVTVNLLTDLVYLWADPRVRSEG